MSKIAMLTATVALVVAPLAATADQAGSVRLETGQSTKYRASDTVMEPVVVVEEPAGGSDSMLMGPGAAAGAAAAVGLLFLALANSDDDDSNSTGTTGSED